MSHSCCGERDPKTRHIDALLGVCARGEGNPLQRCRLVQESDDFTDWNRLPAYAEKHGLAPLCYAHLQAVDALIPAPARLALKGLYLRHRQASQVRDSALVEILAAYQADGIDVLALKGAALAHLAYPQPGLRPMRDLDLLVRVGQAERAQAILCEIGFQPSLALSIPTGHHHMLPMQRMQQGLQVSVELHTHLFSDHKHAPLGSYEDLSPSALPFQVNSFTAKTLGYEDMLWHIYRHTFPWQIDVPMRLVGVADLTSLVEKYLRQIDWGKIRQQHPELLNALPMLHYLSPWSQEVLDHLCSDLSKPPPGPVQDFQGWPRYRLVSQRWKGLRGILRDTFSPSAWWLRLHYGVSNPRALLWLRWVRHPLQILAWAAEYAGLRLKEFLAGLTRWPPSE